MPAQEEPPERTFQSARARLDEILRELESDDADVDQLAARVKEASELLRFCQERLAAIRYDVKRVIAEMAGDEAPAREPAADAAPEPDVQPPPAPATRGNDVRAGARGRPAPRPRDGADPGALPF